MKAPEKSGGDVVGDHRLALWVQCCCLFLGLFVCWFFGPVDARETCFGPCVVAARRQHTLPLATLPDTLA